MATVSVFNLGTRPSVDLSGGLGCVGLLVTPRELCIRYPVGQQLCADLPSVGNADGTELIAALFSKLNSALAPLGPFLTMLDAVVAIFDCVKAIPKVITELDPTEIIGCIPALAEAVGKLLALLPQVAIPVLLLDIIDAFIFFLQSQIASLQRLAAQQAAILAAITRGTEPANFTLRVVADCVNANFSVQLQNMNELNAPINRIIGQINFFFKLLGLQPLPTIGAFVDTSGGIAALQALLDVLEAARALIPSIEAPSLGMGGEC